MSSKDEKKDFMKKATILIDTREQVNDHITQVLAQLGIMTEVRKLDYGDYSFTAEGKDFSHSCVIERKAKIDELYTSDVYVDNAEFCGSKGESSGGGQSYAPTPAPTPAQSVVQSAQAQGVEISMGEFEDILADGSVPF